MKAQTTKGKRDVAAVVTEASMADVQKPPAPGTVATGGASKISLAASVGKEIKNLRQNLKLTANGLASKSGMSKGMLSKIERGTATPSFASLTALSTALNVPVARLFAGHVKREDFSLVRAGKGIEVQRRGPTVGLNYELLGHLLSGEPQIEPYLVTISNSATPGPGFQHPGIEFMYILKGAMQYRYADTIVELHPGDTLVFDSNAIHGHERLLDSPVKFISIVITHRV
jgi:transcriptional regulator with XRE-family HTH domain